MSDFGDLISSYSRAEAIEDGALFDVSAAYPDVANALWRVPVAFTAALWSHIEAAASSVRGASREGFVHDVLFVARSAPNHQTDSTRRTFLLTLDELVWLEAVVGPGDDLEPVLTVGLQGED